MRLSITTLLIILLSACASKPIVDTKGIDIVRYKQDYAECEALSEQVDTGKQVAKSALFGAVVYGALGAVTGNKGSNNMAAIGGITGAAGGASEADQEKSQVLRKCLINRGYNVLN